MIRQALQAMHRHVFAASYSHPSCSSTGSCRQGRKGGPTCNACCGKLRQPWPRFVSTGRKCLAMPKRRRAFDQEDPEGAEHWWSTSLRTLPAFSEALTLRIDSQQLYPWLPAYKSPQNALADAARHPPGRSRDALKCLSGFFSENTVHTRRRCRSDLTWTAAIQMM